MMLGEHQDSVFGRLISLLQSGDKGEALSLAACPGFAGFPVLNGALTLKWAGARTSEGQLCRRHFVLNGGAWEREVGERVSNQGQDSRGEGIVEEKREDLHRAPNGLHDSFNPKPGGSFQGSATEILVQKSSQVGKPICGGGPELKCGLRDMVGSGDEEPESLILGLN